MKHVLTAIFLATATMAQAGECLDKGMGVKAIEGLVSKGYSQDKIYDMFQGVSSGKMSRGKRLRLISETMGWVFIAKMTSEQWSAMCGPGE